jgi:[histone H3]-lysine27 N-methyltransferase
VDKSIKDLTIIREYVGDIDFLKNCEYGDGDRIMTLLSASNPSQSLVVFPDKRSNIALFITGINNHTPYVSSIFKFYSLHMLESYFLLVA